MLYPLIWLLGLFPGPIKKRLEFEDKNNSDPGCVSLNEIGQRAEICFHVSSEGEFELIKPIIDFCLSQSHRIEILFSSPSVQRQIENLAGLYPEKITYLRLPILSFSLLPLTGQQSIFKWVSAKKLMMVRYDFFPELMMLRFSLDRFVLFAASSKSKSNHDFRFRLKKYLYALFDEIFPSTKSDFEFFKKQFPNKMIHQEIDLRSIQILKRQQFANLDEKIKKIFALASGCSYKIILAQMWPEDLLLLKDHEFIDDIRAKKTFCYLAPHNLNDEFLKSLLSKINCDYYLIAKNSAQADMDFILANYEKSPRLIISQIPGILCEIYPFFNFTYVGGGFGKGVHSLLEPFVAGSTIACGPNVKRSTEFDLSLELGHKIKIYDEFSLVNFYPNLKERDLNLVDVSHFIKQNERLLTMALSALGILND